MTGGRRELDLEGPMGASPNGIKRINAGIEKDMDNLSDEKTALAPGVESCEARRLSPERIVGGQLALASKIDDSETEVVQAHLRC